MGREIYAIAEIAGKQVILEPNKDVTVPKLDVEVGQKYTIDKILYFKNGEDIQLGTPYLDGLKFEAIVKEHFRDKKVIVFKKKRRKGYKVKKGHRQHYTILHLDELKKPRKATRKKAVTEENVEEKTQIEEEKKDGT